MPGGSVGDIEGRVDLGRLDPHHQFAGHRVARHIVLFADSARTTLVPFRHPADSRDERVLLRLFRWKVFHVARGDHVRSSDQCRRDHMFVIDIGQSKRAFHALPVRHNGIVECRTHSIDGVGLSALPRLGRDHGV